jgi:hypothetical protein
VVKFVLETDDLVFKLDDFSFAVDQLALLVLEVESLGVNEFVQIVDSGQLLGDVVLESSGLGCQVSTLLALEFILVVELIDFFSILTVSFSQILKFILEMLFLLEQLIIQILVLAEVCLQSRNFNVSGVKDFFLAI